MNFKKMTLYPKINIRDEYEVWAIEHGVNGEELVRSGAFPIQQMVQFEQLMFHSFCGGRGDISYEKMSKDYDDFTERRRLYAQNLLVQNGIMTKEEIAKRMETITEEHELHIDPSLSEEEALESAKEQLRSMFGDDIEIKVQKLSEEEAKAYKKLSKEDAESFIQSKTAVKH